MSDIININIGQAGIRIGEKFLQSLKEEHFPSEGESRGRKVFFKERNKGWEARSIFIDTDKRETDRILLKNKDFYNSNAFITTKQSSRGMYAEGAYTLFPQISQQFTDQLRKMVEQCDHFGGFVNISSLAGGTGSGIGAKVLETQRQCYLDKIVQSFRLFPNTNAVCNPLQIYNSTYSIFRQSEFSEFTMLFDNASTQRNLFQQGVYQPSISDQNKSIGSKIAKTTRPYRFSGSLNTNQRKIATNLILFPRMHFMPFATSQEGSCTPLESALKPENLSLTNYHRGDNIFSFYTAVEDHFTSQQQIYKTVLKQSLRNSFKFTDWLDNKVHMAIHDPLDQPSSCVFVNSFNIRHHFQSIATSFVATYRRKAFQCWYRGVGLDSMQFTQIQSNLNDLISQYTQYDYGFDDEEEIYE